MRRQPTDKIMMIAGSGRIFEKVMAISLIDSLDDQRQRIILDLRQRLFDLPLHLIRRDRSFLHEIIYADILFHDIHLLDAKLQLMIVAEHISHRIHDHAWFVQIEQLFGNVPVFRIHRPALILQRKRKIWGALGRNAPAAAAEQYADGPAVPVDQFPE